MTHDTPDTLLFADDEERDRVPFGEGDRHSTYDERIKQLEEEIGSGGRGNITPDELRLRLKEFRESTDREEYNNQPCHDCGAGVGELHMLGCDMEECPKCGGQLLSCTCDTREMAEQFRG